MDENQQTIAAVNQASARLSPLCFNATVITTGGIWLGENPLDSSVLLLFAQIALIFSATQLTHALLKHLGQPQVVSHVLAGILLGPSCLSRNETFSTLMFPNRSWVNLDMLALLAFLLFIFIVGVKTDLSIIRRSGKKAVVIAEVGTIVPFVAVVAFCSYPRSTPLPHRFQLPYSMLYAGEWAVTSNIVLSSLLGELNLLTSKLGRLAMSASLIADFQTITLVSLGIATLGMPGDTVHTIMHNAISFAAFVAFIIWVARPLTVWMIRRTPKGELMDESHFLTVLLLAMLCALVGVCIGQPISVGPLLLGVLLPGGPPLGTTLTDRLDRLMSRLFLPIFMATAGLRANVDSLVDPQIWRNGMIMVGLSAVAKLGGVVAPCLYFKMPLRDAVVVGLMLNCRGIDELYSFGIMLTMKDFSEQLYTTFILSLLAVAGISAVLVKHLYKPSIRFVACNTRTVQHSGRDDDELRVLVCTHRERDVPPIAALLEVFHPVVHRGVCAYLLHLAPADGRNNTVLAPYKKKTNLSDLSLNEESLSSDTIADHIVNAFRHLERCSQGGLSVLPFIGISPYASMHDDICSLALEKNLSLIILPFHKRTEMGSAVQYADSSVQLVNTSVLRYAPCSVATLIDHGLSFSSVAYNVAVFFLGGPDDHEALAIAARMAENPAVALTAVRFLSAETKGSVRDHEDGLDEEAVEEFRVHVMDRKRVEYREELVKDGAETVQVIRGFGEGFGLFIVGRRYGKESELTAGLEMWSECPELGVIGDILSSADFGGKVSTLVVQQQTRVGEKGEGWWWG